MQESHHRPLYESMPFVCARFRGSRSECGERSESTHTVTFLSSSNIQEVIESVFYAWRATKDKKWREYGEKMWTAIQRYSRVSSGGFAGLSSVTAAAPRQTDRQESFFLAETLKYMWLLFEDDAALDLNKYVLNTEAHPVLRIHPQ